MKKINQFLILVLFLAIAVVCCPNFAKAINWTSQTSGTDYTLTSISFGTNSIGVVSGYSGTTHLAIKRTLNGGTTWEDAGTPPDISAGTSLSKTDVSAYSDSSHVYAAFVTNSDTIADIYYTTTDLVNQSGSWTTNIVTGGMGMEFLFGVKQVNTINVYSAGNMMNMFNFIAKNTTALGGDTALTTLYEIDCTDANTCWGVGSNGQILSTTNGTTASAGTITGVTGTMYGIDMVTSNVGYAVDSAGEIAKCSSTNCANSNNWAVLGTTLPVSLNDISCVDSNTCWTVGNTGKIYKTTDGGTSWTEESSGTTANLNSVNFLDAYHGWIAGANGTILSYLDTTAPVTTASPVGGSYDSAQTVTLSATDTDSGVAATYYTTDGTDPTTSSTVYSTPITISSTTTLKFFSTDIAGNSESVKTESYTIQTEILFNKKIMLKDAILDETYVSANQNIELVFNKLPKSKVIKKLYLKFTRNKKIYNPDFLKEKSYPGYLLMISNIGKVKKAYAKKVSKRVGLKLTINYSQKKIKKLKLKEKNLRIFFQIKDGTWSGPYKVKQNKINNTLKFGLRNYLKKSKESLKTFYFQDLTKIKFIIAEKSAI